MFESHLESLENARRQIIKEHSQDASWVCTAGLWPDAHAPQAAVLKFFKPHWLQEPPNSSPPAVAGIFFSVWIDDDAMDKRGVHYNLHALKLRQLAGHALESRKFASAFRALFAPCSAGWPAVKMAYGPQTLFQGFVKCSPARVEAAALGLVRKFIPLGAMVDDLLSRAVIKRAKPAAGQRAMVV